MRDKRITTAWVCECHGAGRHGGFRWCKAGIEPVRRVEKRFIQIDDNERAIVATPDGRTWEIVDERIPQEGEFYLARGNWWIPRGTGSIERPILEPIDFMLDQAAAFVMADGAAELDDEVKIKFVAYLLQDERTKAATENLTERTADNG